MKGTLKFLLSLGVALVVMLLVRALGFQLCIIEGDALAPHFLAGDRVMVNRWSYGLRTGDGRLFPYGRLARQKVSKGDIVAFDDENGGGLMFGACIALPGDTVRVDGHEVISVPSLKNCDSEDCYYLDNIGIVPEHLILGRATMVIYSHQPDAPPLKGYRYDRLFLSK